MSVLALASAKGAPGVTTSALALALAWPRPVLLVEADVAGSSSVLAGYLQGTRRHDVGLLDLAVAHRRGTLADALHDSSIALPGSQARLVPALTSPAQAAGLRTVWEPVAVVLAALHATGTDVLIDAGRLGVEHGPMPLLRQADLTLLTTRSNLPAIAATRARAGVLREDLVKQGQGADALALLVVGEGQPYPGRELQAAVGSPIAATLAWDPVHAEVFSRGAPAGRRFQASSLVRSVQAAVGVLQQRITDRQQRLSPGTLVHDEQASHA